QAKRNNIFRNSCISTFPLRKSAWSRMSKKENLMHSVIRTYSGKGSKELFDILDSRKSEVANLMKSIKGFVSYTLFRSAEGGSSVTVCQDKMGVDESAKVAKEWIAKNGGNTGVSAPTISE